MVDMMTYKPFMRLKTFIKMCLFFINILSPSSNVIERAVIKVLKHSFNFSRENFNKNNWIFAPKRIFDSHVSNSGKGRGGGSWCQRLGFGCSSIRNAQIFWAAEIRSFRMQNINFRLAWNTPFCNCSPVKTFPPINFWSCD